MWVYGLYAAFEVSPFYIGVTQNPRQRLTAHRAAASGTRLDAISGSGVDPLTMSMRLLASCEERHTAHLIEAALEEHLGVDVYQRRALKRSVQEAQHGCSS